MKWYLKLPLFTLGLALGVYGTNYAVHRIAAADCEKKYRRRNGMDETHEKRSSRIWNNI
jgi:hypothetical protein